MIIFDNGSSVFIPYYWNKNALPEYKLIGSDLTIKSDLIKCTRCPIYYKDKRGKRLICKEYVLMTNMSCLSILSNGEYKEYSGYQIIAKNMTLYESIYLKSHEYNVNSLHPDWVL